MPSNDANHLGEVMPLNDDLGRCAASPAPDDEKPTSPPASIIEVAIEAIANATY